MPVEHDVIVRVLLSEREKLFAFIWSIVRNDHIAEDVLQEVALLAVSHRQEIESDRHLQAWMRKASRYKALEAVRAGRRAPAVLDDHVLDLLESNWEQADEMPAAQMSDALQSCIRKLTPYARKIIQMRYGDGVRSAKIAEQLNRNVQAIYVTLTRVHRSLAECIRGRMAELESPTIHSPHEGDHA